MTQQLGLDQLVVGTNGTQAIFTSNPSDNWQGKGFLFQDSYIAGRPLRLVTSEKSNINPSINHGYVVYNAKYVGDPNATVVSYGPSSGGKLVNQGAGSTINNDDISEWRSLNVQDTGSYTLLTDKNGNPISDQRTQQSTDGLTNYLADNPTTYRYIGTNSNSGASTAAKDTGAINYSVPGLAPGQDTPITPTAQDTTSTPDANGNNQGYTSPSY